jgi:hypothetical protein
MLDVDTPAMLIPLAFVIATGAAQVTGEGVGSGRDGTFASKRQQSSASLNVLVGADGALLYYAGGFGPGCLDETGGGWCRSCELGPVLALREPSGGFLVVSGEGKALLTAKDNAWQLRLVEGEADWCGEGWSGDDFKKNGGGPQPCTVAVDGAELMEAGAKVAAPPRRVVARGERLVALDALPTDEQKLLVKVHDIVGLMRRKDVTCTAR